MAEGNKTLHNLNSDDDDFPDIECEICNKKFSGVSSYELHINGNRHNKKVQELKIKKSLTHNSSKVKPDEESTENGAETILCGLCKISCAGYVPYKQHLKSSKHLKNLNREKIGSSLQNAPEVLPEQKKRETNGETNATDDEDMDAPLPYGKCDTCSKIFYGPESLKTHLEGCGHKKKVAQVKKKANFKSNLTPELGVQLIENDDISDEDLLAPESYAECKTCGKSFSGIESLQMHLESDFHKRKVKNLKLAEKIKIKHDKYEITDENHYLCKECNKQFPDVSSLINHLRNNAHEKNTAKKNITISLENHPEITVMALSVDDKELADVSGELADFYVCKLCKRSFSGPECVKQHVMGKKHRKAKEIAQRLKNLRDSKEANSTSTQNGQNKHDDDEFEIIG